MQAFLKFLKGSPGKVACLFWMDVERMKIAAFKNKKKQLLSRLKSLYIISNAPMTLEGGVREEITANNGHMSSLDEEIESWTKSQELVVSSLRRYWLKTFHSQHPQYSSRQLHLPAVLRVRLTGVDNCDDAQDNELDNISLHTRDFNPSIKTSCWTDSSHVQPSLCIQLLPTDSTCQLFKRGTSKSLASCYQPIGSRWRWSNQGTLVPYLKAALRCNMAAGSPITRYFKKTQPNPDATALLQFWQSVENIFTMEMMGNSNSAQPCHLYLALLKSRPLATDLQTLTDLFIAPNAPFKIDIPQELLKELEHLLPKGLGDDLLLVSQDLVRDVSWSLFVWNTSLNNMPVHYAEARGILERLPVKRFPVFHFSIREWISCVYSLGHNMLSCWEW